MIDFPGTQCPPLSVMGDWDGEVSAKTQQDSYYINIYFGRETQTMRCIDIDTSVMNSPINRYSCLVLDLCMCLGPAWTL